MRLEGRGAVLVVTEGTPGALDAVGCKSVWVKRVHSLGYLRGLWCDKWTNVVALATMAFISIISIRPFLSVCRNVSRGLLKVAAVLCPVVV